MNSVRTLQEPNADIRQQRQQHRTLPPVIGHFAPVGAPAAGGVLIKFWGINFDGKQKKAQQISSKPNYIQFHLSRNPSISKYHPQKQDH